MFTSLAVPLVVTGLILILTTSVSRVLADNLFVGCGDEIDFVDMALTTSDARVCLDSCEASNYTYYTLDESAVVCKCYTYPPPAAEYMPGSPGDCQGEMQYNLIRSDWIFSKCYNWINITQTPSDSFKACLGQCGSHAIAIARPTGTFPGHTECACASERDVEGMTETTCDLDKYFVYQNEPASKSKRGGRLKETAARVSESIWRSSESTFGLAHQGSTPQSVSTPVKQIPEPPSPPPPTCPRMTFSTTRPLTPRRNVAFAPTPLKKLDFSNVKMRATPGRRLNGMKIMATSATKRSVSRSMDSLRSDVESDLVFDRKEDGLQETEDLGVEFDLGALKLSDQPEQNLPSQGMTEEFDSDLEADEVDGDLILEAALDDLERESSAGIHVSQRIMPTPEREEDGSLPPSSLTFTPGSASCLAIDPVSDHSPSGKESDDGEPDWAPISRRTPGKRRIIISDSEDDIPVRQSGRRILNLSDSDNEQHEGPHSSSERSDEGQENENGEDDEGGIYYYGDDDSYGSLRDFIVDDDEEDECLEVGSSGAESDGFEIVDAPPSRKTQRREKRDDSRFDDQAILHYSPPTKRPLILPELNRLVIASSDSEADTEPALTTRRDKKDKSAKRGLSKREWAMERERIASEIFDDLDKRVFEEMLGAGGVNARVEWNNRLLTTAGVARSKRVTKNGETKKEHWIELSEKVLTGKEQILNTVAHEMCHLATWVISNEYKNPHGRIFKSWGRKIMRARKDIKVTTKHPYVIEYKYEWRCSNERCGKIYKRHSKSIDTSKQACGSCKGKLVPLFQTKQKPASAFQLYLKANMKFAKAAMPGSPHGDVMRALSKRWTEAGDSGDHELYWKASDVDIVRQ
ncbi:hypothetical protein IAR55_003297 [Kwoniella newhampshirensis]|uniref:SprT-like domain-containing protein n=1 Tax=Kwoniella newhampshirensis TaxID=1651941 RepID=A0AAW0YYK7_9TREE